MSIVRTLLCMVLMLSTLHAHEVQDKYPELFGRGAKPTIVFFRLSDHLPSQVYQHITIDVLKRNFYSIKVYDANKHSALFQYIDQRPGTVYSTDNSKLVPYTAMLKDGRVRSTWIGVQEINKIVCDPDFSSYKIQSDMWRRRL